MAYSGWLDRKAEGWAWYEDRLEEKLIVEVKEEKPLTSLEQINKAKKELEEKLADAILDPSIENMKAYIEMQNYWMSQSKEFSKLWTKTMLQFPDMDSSVNGRPVTQYGIQLHNKMTSDKIRKLVGEISESHALFFFYEGKSKISQALGIVIKEFSKKYHWEITPVCVDGSILEMFPENLLNNRLSEDMGVKTFPSIMVVDPISKEAIPIAYGLASIDQIERNIQLQFEHMMEGL